ncbi:MAG: 50S ribosomal protein L29 [Candidatus Vogelbacteria bacterium CG10_big_fil_rev_8_21_14_0_10_49_38]|uniref:Large ribosomal subunit protein uL29 n=1 Tax=Candidatus Vogelbacteria bacterium CG10_big_fil_rev_8_21_14_0_10_49_38 TaxID=1975043 RepID=A0A2H0RIX3_9BACT|nr:MAG: 50S ribosomal protein L29 [bacterium CG10_49_38]PIR46390.1 MAG: 50S ribosomal protein L29 [Candidatus Vogelbacteria bacterium CG10_big_fil_rev_8_21_14_0_10_49_38]
MKKTDYQKESKTDLQKALTQKREALANFRFGISGSRTKNVKEGRSTRRDIARILTALKRQA